MKKCFIYVLLLALLVMLSGCVTLDRSWCFLHGTDEIDKIEIYFLEEGTQFNVPDDAEPVGVIAPESYADFCREIQSIDFTVTVLLLPAAVDPSWYLDGYVVRIFYQNGDSEMICDQGFQEQEVTTDIGSRSMHYSFPESFDWDAFVKRYLD